MVKYAAVGPISVYLPPKVETSEQLRVLFPSWNLDQIERKTGIYSRRIAEPDVCASDLGVAAAEQLFADHDVDPASIDFLLLCTQTPDYPLPTTSCMMQDRLGLRTSIGALDFNLGCSGFVYGLSLADGLIRSGSVKRVLLVTAETYTKYIHPDDRSLRTIFSDGAAATLIEAADEPTLGSFRFGTDGTAADTLFVTEGGARPKEQWLQPRSRRRWSSPLYMDGPAILAISLEVIPHMVHDVLNDAGLSCDDVDLFIFHQATRVMLEHLRQHLGVEEDRVPIVLKDVGNTVSSTIPIVIDRLRTSGHLRHGMRNILVGFGVGFSWAGCTWRETWTGKGR